MLISHPCALLVYAKSDQEIYFLAPSGTPRNLPLNIDPALLRSRKAYAIGNLVRELAAFSVGGVHYAVSVRRSNRGCQNDQPIISANDGEREECYLVTEGDWEDVLGHAVATEHESQLVMMSRPAAFYPFSMRLADMPSRELARVTKTESGFALDIDGVEGSVPVENVADAIRRMAGFVAYQSKSGMGPVNLPPVSLGNGVMVRQIGSSGMASLYVVTNPERQAAAFRIMRFGEGIDLKLSESYYNAEPPSPKKPDRRKKQVISGLNLADMLCGIADVDYWSFLHIDGKVTEFTGRHKLKDAMIRAADLGVNVMSFAESDKAVVVALEKGIVACNLVNGAVYRARGIFDADDVLELVASHSWALIAASNAGNGRIKEEGCTFIVGPHSVNLSRYKYLQKVQGLIGPGSQYPGIARAYKGDVDTTKLGTNSLPGLMLVRDDAGIERFYNVPGGLGYLRAIVDGELPGWFNSTSPMHPSAGWGAIPPGQSVVTYPMPESPLASFEPTPDSHVAMIRERLKNGR